MNEFILALFSAEDKLKPSTLYQVLVGKRTSSVLTYAFFHDLLPLSAVLPELAEKQFYEHLRQLQKEQRLRTDGELLSAAAPTAREPRLSEVDFFKYGRNFPNNISPELNNVFWLFNSSVKAYPNNLPDSCAICSNSTHLYTC